MVEMRDGEREGVVGGMGWRGVRGGGGAEVCSEGKKTPVGADIIRCDDYVYT